MDSTNELQVMQAVAEALASLPDDDARRRVLRWMLERFAPALAAETPFVSAAPGKSPSTAPAPTPQVRPRTSVDDLVFPGTPVGANGVPDGPLDDPENLRSLFDDFPMPSAEAAPGERAPGDNAHAGAAPAEAPRAAQSETKSDATSPDSSAVAASVESFVAEFQKIARDWKSA